MLIVCFNSEGIVRSEFVPTGTNVNYDYCKSELQPLQMLYGETEQKLGQRLPSSSGQRVVPHLASNLRVFGRKKFVSVPNSFTIRI